MDRSDKDAFVTSLFNELPPPAPRRDHAIVSNAPLDNDVAHLLRFLQERSKNDGKPRHQPETMTSEQDGGRRTQHNSVRDIVNSLVQLTVEPNDDVIRENEVLTRANLAEVKEAIQRIAEGVGSLRKDRGKKIKKFR